VTGRSEHSVPPLPSILVVDADADTRELYRHTATLVGWQLVEASDGRDGLAKALARPPTLVLTEITLPLLDGYALCETLRRDRTTADIPILVVTAEVRPAHLARAWRAGADCILLKPVPPEDVLNEIKRLLTPESRENAAATRAEKTMQAERAHSVAFLRGQYEHDSRYGRTPSR
jgi:DNA-binding response OmpR family regulator